MRDIPRSARMVCDELVNCPVRRTDTEVEACWHCPWLQKTDPDRRYVVCKPPFAQLPPPGTEFSRS